MKRRAAVNLLIFLATFAFIAGGTILMIRYAQGYRPTMEGTIRGTGLLAANSFPNGAEVYINDRLTSATDTTLNLDPAEYTVSIRKDGYFAWTKKLNVQKELVTQTNATLFPMSPSLEPLTFTGALNPVPAPDGNKIAYAVASASAVTKNGLYVQDLSASTISLTRSARQIARNSSGLDYAHASYTWSPNGSQILVSFTPESNILLEADRFNDVATIKDMTATLPTVLQEWELEIARQERTQILKLPDAIQAMTLDSSASGKLGNLYLSPDGEKLLYQAKNDFTLPDHILPALPSSSTQVETRNIKAGTWYVYDLKEDKNFEVGVGAVPSASPSPAPKNTKAGKAAPVPAPFTLEKLFLLDNLKSLPPAELGSSPSAYRKMQKNYSTKESISLFNAQYAPIHVTRAQWYPDSYHLILTNDSAIDIVEYDNTNRTTVYAGPFDPSFVYPWPDGSKLVTRIQFSPETIPNLYTIKLK